MPFWLVGIATVSLGCGTPPQDDDRTAATQEPDRIGAYEDPGRLLPGASSRLSDDIGRDDVGATFGTDDGHIPYPDTYWPFVLGGIDQPWSPEATPLEKYMRVADPAHFREAKRWEHDHHGKGAPHLESWNGHCDGWTAAAMTTSPIRHPVDARPDGRGGVEPCDPGGPDCTRFEIGDVNALAAEVYLDADVRFIGARCDKKPADIRRNTYGRIVRDGSGCHGLNPGALLVVLAQQMKRRHRPLAIDAQTDFQTDQVWNQPAYRYTVHRFEALTTSEAANLVATGRRDGRRTKYEWDPRAAGFVFVDIGIRWVREHGPNFDVVSGASSTGETRFVAVIELDAPPSDPAARIIGGEYLNDESVGADRLTVPPFVWTAERVEPEAPARVRNPYVNPGVVERLIRLGERRVP